MRNYSQKYISSRLGISQNAYSKIENNITQLTVHHVKELSKILEVAITDLLNDDFEIHRSVPVPARVTKQDVMVAIETLQKKLQSKHATRHDGYMVALSMIIAAENAINGVH